MAKKTELDIVVTANADQAQKELKDLGTAGKKAGGEIEKGAKEANGALAKLKASASGIGGSFTSAFKGIGAAFSQAKIAIIAVTAAVTGAVVVTKKLTDAWLAEEKSLRGMNDALAAHGYSVKEARAEIDAFADSIQATSKFGDDMTRGALQSLLDMNMSLKEAMESTRVAMDLSVAKNIDLGTAVELLGKAYNGQIGTLSRYGIVVDQAKFKTEGYKAVLEALSGFEGRAASDAENLATKIEMVKNYAGDATEAIGQGLVAALMQAVENSTSATGGMNDLGNAVKQLSDWVATFLVPSLSAGIELLVTFAKSIKETAVGKTFGAMGRLMQDFTPKGMLKFSQDMAEATGAMFTSKSGTWEKFKEITDPKNWKKRVEQSRKIMSEMQLATGVSDTGARPGGGLSDKDKKDSKELSLLKQGEFEIEKTIVEKRLEGLDALKFQKEAYSALLGQLEKAGAKEEDLLDIKKKIWEADKGIAEQFKKQTDEQNKLDEAIGKYNEDLMAAKEKQQAEIEAMKKAYQEQTDALKESLETEKSRNVFAEQTARMTERMQEKLQDAQVEEKKNGVEAIRDRVEKNRLALQYQGLEEGTLEYLAQDLVFLEQQTAALEKKAGLSKEEYSLLIEKKKVQQELNALQRPEDKILKERTEAENALQAEASAAMILGDEYDVIGKRIEIVKKQLEDLRKAGGDPRQIANAERELAGLGKAQKVQAAEKEMQEKMKADVQDLQNTLADTFKTGIKSGWKAGLEGFTETLKNKILDAFTEDLAKRIMGQGSGLAGLLGGGGGSNIGGEGGFSMPGGGLSGAAAAMGMAGGGMGGGGFGPMDVAGAAATGGKVGGAAGIFGKISPYLGIAMLAMSFLKKGGGPVAQTGVAQMFGQNVVGGNMGALFGSEEFQRGAFSARNAAGDVTRNFASARGAGGGELKITVEPAPGLDDVIASKTVNVSIRGGRLGTPRRTGSNT